MFRNFEQEICRMMIKELLLLIILCGNICILVNQSVLNIEYPIT